MFPGDYMAGEPPSVKRGAPAVPLDPREAPFQDYNDQLWAKHGLLPARITEPPSAAATRATTGA